MVKWSITEFEMPNGVYSTESLCKQMAVTLQERHPPPKGITETDCVKYELDQKW